MYPEEQTPSPGFLLLRITDYPKVRWSQIIKYWRSCLHADKNMHPSCARLCTMSPSCNTSAKPSSETWVSSYQAVFCAEFFHSSLLLSLIPSSSVTMALFHFWRHIQFDKHINISSPLLHFSMTFTVSLGMLYFLTIISMSNFCISLQFLSNLSLPFEQKVLSRYAD